MSDNQTSDLSPEEAKALGFKPPQGAQVAPAAPKTTRVVGYFNNNPWPVHVSLSDYGISLNLQNRGDYVRDTDGNKINDPALEAMTGENMLSREMSDTPVPIRMIVPPDQKPINENKSFHGTQEFKTDKSGAIAPGSMQAAVVGGQQADNRDQLSQLQTSRTPVIGMTMDKARELNIVKPTVAAPLNTPDDSTGVPTAGEIQSLEDISPRDATPGEARRLKAGQAQNLEDVRKLQDAENAEQAKQTTLLEQSVQTTPPPGTDAVQAAIANAQAQVDQPVVVPQSKVLTEADPDPVPAPPAPDAAPTPADESLEVEMNPVDPSPPADPVAEAEAFANEPIPDGEDDGFAAVETEDAESRAMTPPNLEDTQPAQDPVPESEDAVEKPFLCPDDGKRFTHRSFLNRHVSRQVKAGKMTEVRAQEIMDGYPTTRKAYTKGS